MLLFLWDFKKGLGLSCIASLVRVIGQTN
jgi:hypothetical protein